MSVGQFPQILISSSKSLGHKVPLLLIPPQSTSSSFLWRSCGVLITFEREEAEVEGDGMREEEEEAGVGGRRRAVIGPEK